MRLYEINQQIEGLLNQVNDDGEILDGVFEQLTELQLAESDKLEAIGCLLKNWKSDADAIREEEKKLSDRRRAIENRTERLRDYAAWYMRQTGKQKFSSPRVVLSFRKSTSVDVLDDTKIPDAYVEYERKVKKSGISTAIKAGVVVPGAALVEKQNLQVR